MVTVANRGVYQVKGLRRAGLTALRTLQRADLDGGDFAVGLPDPQALSRWQ